MDGYWWFIIETDDDIDDSMETTSNFLCIWKLILTTIEIDHDSLLARVVCAGIRSCIGPAQQQARIQWPDALVLLCMQAQAMTASDAWIVNFYFTMKMKW